MKYRVWVIFNPPDRPIVIPVLTLNEVMALFYFLADISTKLQSEDECNVSGLEVQDTDGDWVEWYDKDGNNIEHYWEIHNNAFDEMKKVIRLDEITPSFGGD